MTHDPHHDLSRRVATVICHYRTPHLLRNCLDSLRPYIERGMLVVVIDNDSQELVPDWIPADFPGVNLVDRGENLGYSKAINLGMSLFDTEFALILNPDIVVKPGSVEALLDTADQRPDAGVVAPKLLNPDGTLQHSCRRFYDFATFVYRRTPLGKIFPNSSVIRRHMMLDYDHAETRVVDWTLGGAMLVRSAAVDDVGGMDERFFLYFEDVDWCYRMHRRGWPVVYEPASTMVHHHQRESAKKPLGKSFFSHLMSVVRFYEKWSLVLYVLKNQRREWEQTFRLLFDVVGINLGFVAAYLIRGALGAILEKPVFPVSSYEKFWLFGNALTLGIFYGLGFYRRSIGNRDWVDRLFDLGKGTGIATVIMMATTFLLLQTQSYSRTMVLLYWPLSTLFLLALRQFAAWLAGALREQRLDLPRVVVIGSDRAMSAWRKAASSPMELGFEAIHLPRSFSISAPGAPAAAERVLSFLRSERASSVYFISADESSAEIAQWVPALTRAGVTCRIRPAFSEVLNLDSRVEDLGGTWVVTLGGGGGWRARGVLKRTLDVLVALVAIVVGAIPNALFFFRGRWRGRVRLTTETRMVQPGTRFRYRMYHPRPRGNLLSVVLFDHYPRLFSVLSGTLSFVGTYPFREAEFEQLTDSLKRVALDARPGITGRWWFSRGEANSPDRIRSLDIEYVQRWSNVNDAKTLLRAIAALFRTRGRLPELEAGAPRTDTERDEPSLHIQQERT